MTAKIMCNKIKRGERCWLCRVSLNDCNRSGSTLEPMCKRCEIRVGFLDEFMARGGTRVVLQDAIEATPVALYDYMRFP